MTAELAVVVVAQNGNSSLLSSDGVLLVLGGTTGALAILGLLLLLPLYMTQRREVERLLAWRESEPDAGTTEFRAVTAAEAEAAARPAGRMTPAERVTSERPALARITTSERAALELEQAPFWRRAVERGPRHPLVLTLLALLIAAAVIVAAALLIRSDSDEGGGAGTGGGVDPSSVQIVVVNAAASSGIAGDVGDNLTADGFDVTGTTVASDSVRRSTVRYAKGFKREGGAVARSLGLPKPAPFDAEAEAAADGADVVVVAGRDVEPATDGGQG